MKNVNGGAGDDILIGDDNGDVLKAGSGNTILIGGTGADTLIAGSGRDILIGGAGADTLTAGAGDDILIAGTTTFGTTLTPLQAIMTEWKSGNNFATRRQHLLGTQPGGLNAAFLIADATVANDVSTDTLNAGAGNDWFWGLNNEILGAKPGDKIGSQP